MHVCVCTSTTLAYYDGSVKDLESGCADACRVLLVQTGCVCFCHWWFHRRFRSFSVCKGWLWSLTLMECVYCFWWDGYFHEVNYYNLWAWDVFMSLCVFFTSLTQDLKFSSLWLGIVLGLLFSSGLFSWFPPCIPITAIWEDYWVFFFLCVLTLYPTMFLKLCAGCQRFLVESLGSFKINHLSQFLKNFFPYLYAFYSLFLLL